MIESWLNPPNPSAFAQPLMSLILMSKVECLEREENDYYYFMTATSGDYYWRAWLSGIIDIYGLSAENALIVRAVAAVAPPVEAAVGQQPSIVKEVLNVQ